ncbi:hypothetical protein GCM10027578_22400 [Spirosoma luteolum]
MFTTEKKYGYADGDHVANWGTQFPVFARVVNGKLYAVAREDRPDHPTPGRFGSVFFCSREWLKATVFGAYKAYADLFEDKSNNVADTSEPGSSFSKTSDAEGIVKAPVVDTATTPLPGNTSTTTLPGNPSTATPTGTPSTATTPAIGLTSNPPATGATTAVAGLPWKTIGLGIGAVIVALGVWLFLRPSKK